MRIDPPVVIVGGGAAGLSAAGALSHRGIDAVVLERDAGIGATWARRYDRLHLHTVRRFSGLAHYPIPSRYPNYLSRDEYVSYLNDYVDRFGLRIETGVDVEAVRRPSLRDGAWTVHAANGTTWQSRVVVIATGQYSKPVMPAWPGREDYRGSLVHSAAYRNGRPYAGLRVLVIGAGNSGAEIATDAIDSGAAAVAISVRTPPTIVPRDPFGMPIQRTSIMLSVLPAAIANRIGRFTARLVIGDLSAYGMPAGAFAPYTNRRIPLIDVGFVDALKRGRITVRPAVERLTSDGVVYGGGQHEKFDAIIAATGFSCGLESVLEAGDALDERGEPRGRSGEPTACPGLYFVGFTHSLRGHLFEANLASRRLARHVQRFLRGR